MSKPTSTRGFWALFATQFQGAFNDKVEASIELKSEYADGLRDLDGFSHAILIYYFQISSLLDLLLVVYF